MHFGGFDSGYDCKRNRGYDCSRAQTVRGGRNCIERNCASVRIRGWERLSNFRNPGEYNG
jgi:hypothetical protein